jgi:acetyltransferase-like isoleucine patch superfamily enzyme
MTEMHQCLWAGLLRQLSGKEKTHKLALKLSLKMEGGEFYSRTARWIMEKRHQVLIGDYSYGECFVPGTFPSGVIIGRYVSIGPGVRVFRRNHPVERLSMHPFFYNQWLGMVQEDNILSASLEIGHDAWIGAGAIILPSCSKVGLGAVIGAGSVVTRNVPDFAIVAGNPARLIRMRFSEILCEKIRESRWWERNARECIQQIRYMTSPLAENYLQHPLLTKKTA